MRGAHIVALQHLEHGGARHAEHDAPKADRYRAAHQQQDEMPARDRPQNGTQPPAGTQRSFLRKDQDRDRADHKHRDGKPEAGRTRQHAIDRAAGAQRGDRAERQTEHTRSGWRQGSAPAVRGRRSPISSATE